MRAMHAEIPAAPIERRGGANDEGVRGFAGV
jgi:hypothetical protein